MRNLIIQIQIYLKQEKNVKQVRYDSKNLTKRMAENDYLKYLIV